MEEKDKIFICVNINVYGFYNGYSQYMETKRLVVKEITARTDMDIDIDIDIDIGIEQKPFFVCLRQIRGGSLPITRYIRKYEGTRLWICKQCHSLPYSQSLCENRQVIA